MAGNSFFQFKQFRINQDRCAMKVCTDACVLGAWVDVAHATRILDIGAGTGLLSLMAAQRNPDSRIDAVEVDEVAAQQAFDNIAASLFAEQIQVFSTSIQAFQADQQYDVIISNPPFFQSDLRSPNSGKNQAHHAKELNFADLLASVVRLLKKSGHWNVLLPVEESHMLQRAAKASGWVPYRQLLLAHQPGRKPFRILTAYISDKTDAVTNQQKKLFIYENNGNTYTSAFRALLKEYYLVF